MYIVIVILAVFAISKNYGIIINAKIPAMPISKIVNKTDFDSNTNLINILSTIEIILLVVIFIDLLVKLINDYSVKKIETTSCNKVSKEQASGDQSFDV